MLVEIALGICLGAWITGHYEPGQEMKCLLIMWAGVEIWLGIVRSWDWDSIFGGWDYDNPPPR